MTLLLYFCVLVYEYCARINMFVLVEIGWYCALMMISSVLFFFLIGNIERPRSRVPDGRPIP